MLLTAVAAVPVAIWIYLLTARGGFWRVSKNLASGATAAGAAGRVVAIIPARNEAETIGKTVESLVAQDFPAPLHVIVVDDGSTDSTNAAARAAGDRASASERLTILRANPLAHGWTGKLWALSQGIARAETFGADYYLLTDADIRHGRHVAAQLVAIAEAGGYDLVSYMVKLECSTIAEKALIPAFVFFFFMLYPPAWIRSEKHKTAGAAGGCVLIRPEALRRMGGIGAIAGEVIDDCALARGVKRNGGRVWLGLTKEAHSLRSYGTLGEIGRMISRTAFSQLRHSGWLLAGTVAGLLVVYLLPPLMVFSGDTATRILGAAAWILMSASYIPMVRFYGRNAGWSLGLPLIAGFYLGATIHSAVTYWRGHGGEWKGRIQDVPPTK